MHLRQDACGRSSSRVVQSLSPNPLAPVLPVPPARALQSQAPLDRVQIPTALIPPALMAQAQAQALVPMAPALIQVQARMARALVPLAQDHVLMAQDLAQALMVRVHTVRALRAPALARVLMAQDPVRDPAQDQAQAPMARDLALARGPTATLMT